MEVPTARRVRNAAAGLILAVTLIAGTTPAQASERPIDITGYSVSSLTVADSNCRNVTVKASSKVKSDYDDAYAIIDVTRNGGVVHSLWFENRKVSDRATICPSWDGLGAYKVGPADVSASYSYWDSYYQSTWTEYVDYTDRTSKTFYVRGKTKSSLTAKRSGSKVALTAKAQVYSPEKYRYGQYNAKKAKFQVKSGNSWKTLKTVNLKKGTAKLTVKQSKKKSYRLSIPTASWATATNSKSVSK
ncbi:hypothetical protein NMP99_07030 [Glutamicibacter mishrai]|uniref:Calcium-binding protein n=1 Tax=Glutamicibacter mishrai TaxID=1775880 RepID=A0A6H0SM60_9MICC|nr:hypothetical protein [Glutamicibacter mishrai]QIV88250.1 hypothetical protein D3791_14720 [Glutamicibacter mishrai]UTT41017.1 hypothetical protein NMP99_07030 [Glutamicibacter mishrai]